MFNTLTIYKVNRILTMLYKDRPIIKIEPTLFDKVLEFASLILIVTGLILAYYMYGEPNIPKTFVILFPAIFVLMYLSLTLLVRFPEKFNYLVKITPENSWVQYFLGVRLIRFVKLWTLFLFDSIMLIIFLRLDKEIWTIVFIVISFIMFIIGFAYYIYLSFKNK